MTLLLMLEDNASVAASRALEPRGITVCHVATVAEARAAYTPDLYDVMLVDYELPDGNGLDFLAGVRSSDKARTILFSGLDRSRELADAGLEVDSQFGKSELPELLAHIQKAWPA